MSKKWYQRNPPKLFDHQFKRQKNQTLSLLNYKLKQLLSDSFEEPFEQNAVVFNRWMRDFVNYKYRIIIHHEEPSKDEMKLYQKFNFSFFKLDQNQIFNNEKLCDFLYAIIKSIYIEPVSKSWQNEERIISETIGMDLWSQSSPCIFNEESKQQHIEFHKDQKLDRFLQFLISGLDAQKNFEFQKWQCLFHRFVVPLVSHKKKIVLLNRPFKRFEKIFYKKFGYQVIFLKNTENKSGWFSELHKLRSHKINL